ncbi:MAG: ATP-binding protein [Candidatus Aminicenantales bacterium]|jgi:two-component system sensor histidine kinase PilS (NtrC family)
MTDKVDRKSILLMIIFRGIIVTLLLLLALAIEYSASFSFSFIPFIKIILAAYILSAAYFLFYYWGRYPAVQAYVQVILDLVLITALVYATGGTASSAYFLYVFPIMGAALILSNRASYLTASLAAILFGGLVDGMYLGVIPSTGVDTAAGMTLGSVLYLIFVPWSAFFLIAFLTNSLAGRLRKTRLALHEAERELLVRERLSAAGRVSASLAHEIRNPLAAISGSVQVLKKELALNPEQRELMEIVLKESERVSHNLDQFLDFALPTKQVFSVISLPELLDETLKILKAGGELNGRVQVQGNFLASGLHYYGSPGQFKQVFWNIIKNAIRAMPGSGVLNIDFLGPRMSEIELRFSDSGKGMSREEKEHLFEPFHSGFEGGRGLGLAVVRRIVDDYDGRIDIRSELDHGTEVVITLPVRETPKN